MHLGRGTESDPESRNVAVHATRGSAVTQPKVEWRQSVNIDRCDIGESRFGFFVFRIRCDSGDALAADRVGDAQCGGVI